MPIAALELSSSPASTSPADVLVVFATSGDDGPELVASPGLEWVAGQLRALGASGGAEEVTRLAGRGDAAGREGGARIVAVVGVGERADASSIRLAAGAALRGLNDL